MRPLVRARGVLGRFARLPLHVRVLWLLAILIAVNLLVRFV